MFLCMVRQWSVGLYYIHIYINLCLYLYIWKSKNHIGQLFMQIYGRYWLACCALAAASLPPQPRKQEPGVLYHHLVLYLLSSIIHHLSASSSSSSSSHPIPHTRRGCSCSCSHLHRLGLRDLGIQDRYTSPERPIRSIAESLKKPAILVSAQCTSTSTTPGISFHPHHGSTM